MLLIIQFAREKLLPHHYSADYLVYEVLKVTFYQNVILNIYTYDLMFFS